MSLWFYGSVLRIRTLQVSCGVLQGQIFWSMCTFEQEVYCCCLTIVLRLKSCWVWHVLKLFYSRCCNKIHCIREEITVCGRSKTTKRLNILIISIFFYSALGNTPWRTGVVSLIYWYLYQWDKSWKKNIFFFFPQKYSGPIWKLRLPLRAQINTNYSSVQNIKGVLWRVIGFL